MSAGDEGDWIARFVKTAMTSGWPAAASEVGSLLATLGVVEVAGSTSVTDEGVGITNLARDDGGALSGHGASSTVRS